MLLLVLLLLLLPKLNCDGLNMGLLELPECTVKGLVFPNRDAPNTGLAAIGEHIWDGLISVILFKVFALSAFSLAPFSKSVN